MKSLTLYLLLLLPQFVFSAASPTVEVLGKIVKHDKKTVTISQEDQRAKSKITVPKKSVPKHFKIRTGQCVYAVLDYKEFMNHVKEQESKTKRQPASLRK